MALPQYLAIASHIQSDRKIFLQLNDVVKSESIRNLKKRSLTRDSIFPVFDEYKEIRGIELAPRSMNYISRKIYNLGKFYQQKSDILSFLDHNSPEAVFLLSDGLFSDRVITSWAKKNDIPILLLQPSFIKLADSVGSYAGMVTKLIKSFKIVFSKIVALLLQLPLFPRQKYYGLEDDYPHLLLWGRKFIISTNRSNTFFVGNPAMDKIFGKKIIDNENIKSKILICTTDVYTVWGMDTHISIIKSYRELIKSLPDYHFILKIHPREDRAVYDDIFNNFNCDNYTITHDGDLYTLFDEVSIQISNYSYTSLEALISGKRIINMCTDEMYTKIEDLFDDRVNIRVRNTVELVDAINKVNSQEYISKFEYNRIEFLSELFANTSGKSGELVVELMYKFINMKL